MSRRRYVPVLLLSFAIAGVFGLAAMAQTDSEDLAAKVNALEKRLANLEKTLNTRLASIERKVSQGGSSAELEQKASAAYAEIARLRNAGDYEQAKSKLGEFMKTYGTTRVAQRARKDVQELAVIGKTAPTDWAIEKWFQGEDQIDLTSDKATLVVFWEIWCPHCKREVPKLQQMYTELKDEGLQVVGLTQINKSATEEKVQAFISTSKLSYPIAKTSAKTNTYFNVSGIPAAAVVKDGKIVWRGHPAQLNADKLRSWL
jgi:thiol-disulfide isomerase/thioredoxin